MHHAISQLLYLQIVMLIVDSEYARYILSLHSAGLCYKQTLNNCTVKPAVAVTSIKRDPPLSGHFRVPPNDFECKCTSIKRAPVQRGQRSAKFAPKR